MIYVGCLACGKTYSEEEAKKLKLFRATACPEITVLKVYCECGHILDILNLPESKQEVKK